VAVFAAVAVVVVEIPAAAETAWQTDPAAAEAAVVGIVAGQTAVAAVEAAGGERQQLVVFFWDQTVPAWDQACYGPVAAVAVGPQHYSA